MDSHFYVVTAILNDKVLGDEKILIGMQTQGRMIVDRQKIFILDA